LKKNIFLAKSGQNLYLARFGQNICFLFFGVEKKGSKQIMVENLQVGKKKLGRSNVFFFCKLKCKKK